MMFILDIFGIAHCDLNVLSQTALEVEMQKMAGAQKNEEEYEGMSTMEVVEGNSPQRGCGRKCDVYSNQMDSSVLWKWCRRCCTE